MPPMLADIAAAIAAICHCRISHYLPFRLMPPCHYHMITILMPPPPLRLPPCCRLAIADIAAAAYFSLRLPPCCCYKGFAVAAIDIDTLVYASFFFSAIHAAVAMLAMFSLSPSSPRCLFLIISCCCYAIFFRRRYAAAALLFFFRCHITLLLLYFFCFRFAFAARFRCLMLCHTLPLPWRHVSCQMVAGAMITLLRYLCCQPYCYHAGCCCCVATLTSAITPCYASAFQLRFIDCCRYAVAAADIAYMLLFAA